jgi:hypothetical protein
MGGHAQRTKRVRPSVDFTALPDGLEGQWVVVSTDTRQVLGSGATPEQAMERANVELGDPDVVLTRVPEGSYTLLL